MKDPELDNLAKESLLYDFYGGLLTDKQREVMELYHEENYSIVEIAGELGVSKQAVHDNLKKTERILSDYEDKLGLVSKFVARSNALRTVRADVESLKVMLAENEEMKDLSARIDEIETLLKGMEE
ncbi:MAG: YlxM family DNA-binding protein [Firmicutes bacterium]|nr:YlxM family DNA-binding protein [Bacillota bacterium]MBQ2304685.1 YlxM family DNA-binding protein [Bacillota bacterium]MBR2748439.1 YlxM family DNA-binding protein [Bacillota bacterium]